MKKTFYTHTHLLSLFCSRIARISLQYSLLASNGIFAWEQTGRERPQFKQAGAVLRERGPQKMRRCSPNGARVSSPLLIIFSLPALSGEGLLKVSPRKVKKFKKGRKKNMKMIKFECSRLMLAFHLLVRCSGTHSKKKIAFFSTISKKSSNGAECSGAAANFR